MSILIDQCDPFLGIRCRLPLGCKLCFDTVNLVDQFALPGLVLLGQHIEVVARDALRSPVLVHLGKQPVHLRLALLDFGKPRSPFLRLRGASLVTGFQKPF